MIKQILLIIIFTMSTLAKDYPIIAFSKIYGEPEKNNYVKWIKKYNKNIKYINLYEIQKDSLRYYLSKCSGLILTGGEDVHPANFGKPEQVDLCEMDLYRDTIEFQSIKIAEELELPILGICRGEQILNVYHGGDLIVDIPSQYNSKIKINHRDSLNKNIQHKININKNSLLYKIIGKSKGKVNSSHHQAVDRVAPKFIVSARSIDGIAEAIERENNNKKPFLLAVQWHPERDLNIEFSKKIAKKFLKEVNKKFLFVK